MHSDVTMTDPDTAYATEIHVEFEPEEDTGYVAPDRAKVAHPAWESPPADAPSSLDPISQEELSDALAHSIGLAPQDAFRDAGLVMDLFGFDDRIIDNVLSREDRQLFYVLEEEGLLSTDREETILHDGREWRTHYWSFRKEVIRERADERRHADVARRAPPPEEELYRRLPADLWGKRTM